jgi:drug/metabolite transporter (DMT)-like permease
MPVVAALVTVTLWASAFVGIRAARIDLTAGPLTLARVGIAAVVLGLVVAWRREALPPRRDVPRLVLFGLLWFGAYNVLLNEAERRVDAGTAAMLVNVGPILIALLAGLLLKEGFPRSLVVGCAVAFAGAVVIGLATSNEEVAATWGAALCLAAAAAYAGAVIAQKPLLERTGGLQLTFLGCVIGTLACLPFAPALVDEASHADTPALLWAVYLGVFPTAIGFTTWAYALKRTSAGKMGATTYLVPPLAILIAWAMLGETPPALALAGGLLCLAGVAITRGLHRPHLPRRARTTATGARSRQRPSAAPAPRTPPTR